MNNHSNFGRLVLGCIEADFCNQGLILQHFSRSTRKSSSREQIVQISAKFQKISQILCRSLSGAKACKSCRSRQELSNDYFVLACKIGFDTAENERIKHLQQKLRENLQTSILMQKYANLVDLVKGF